MKTEKVKVHESFAERLSRARKSRNLTQEELSKLTGITNTQIAHYEAGEREPSITNLAKLVIGLEVSANYLLGLNPNIDFITVLDVYTPIGTFEYLLSQLTKDEIQIVRELMGIMIKRKKQG